jgi:acetyltransferase-like isoleucine patch superfamily enzyme
MDECEEQHFHDHWKLGVQGFRDLWSLHKDLRDTIKVKYDRSLPLGEELGDRWEKASALGFGQGTSVYDSSIVMGDVKVGENTWVGPQTILDGRGGLRIGDYCSVSAGVHLYSHDSVRWALSGGRIDEVRQRTEIGNYCYIGPQSLISSGIRVGDHCVLGANSFLKQDLPSFSIAAGSPAKVIGKVVIDGDDISLVYD